MIDIEKTISLRGYDPLMLTYGSGKDVWRVCNHCGNGGWVVFQAYHDLCKACANSTPETREAARLKTIEQFSDPKAREADRLRSTEYWAIQSNRDAMSEIITNSEAAKANTDRQRGGNDLCWHHIAYDFKRPEALRVKITRKFHGSIHHPPGIPISKRGYSLID